jgi:hypothetical protein
MNGEMVGSRLTSAMFVMLCGCLLSDGATITQLLDASDAVVIASPGGFIAQTNSTLFNLSVISWLSPMPAGAPQSLPVVWVAPQMIRQSVDVTGPGIWFLKSRGDGRYNPVPGRKAVQFRDLYYDAAARGTCPASLAYTAAGQPSDKIALELACAAALENTDYRHATNMASAFRLVASSPAVHNACTYLAQLPRPRQRSIGIACLIAGGETSSMQLLEGNLQQLGDEDLSRVVMLGGWRNPDPAAVQSLGRIATGPRAGGMFQFSAATALQEIHTAETLPYLAKLLDSSDRQVRLRAFIGFGAFVTGLPIHTEANHLNLDYTKPSPTPYSSDPSWKTCAIRWDSSDADLNAAAACWKAWLRVHPELPQEH